MLAKEELKVVSDFFLEGAKIMFASLVVGVFVPGATGKMPWLTFVAGMAMTMLFLIIAARLSKMEAKKE